jgi:hypothetical protein
VAANWHRGAYEGLDFSRFCTGLKLKYRYSSFTERSCTGTDCNASQFTVKHSQFSFTHAESEFACDCNRACKRGRLILRHVQHSLHFLSSCRVAGQHLLHRCFRRALHDAARRRVMWKRRFRGVGYVLDQAPDPVQEEHKTWNQA